MVLKCAILVFLSLNGCAKKASPFRQVSEHVCRRIIDSPTASTSTKELAEKVLKNWDNGRLDVTPVLIYAGSLYSADTGKHNLVLFLSDEQNDIEELVVEEIHRSEDDADILLKEQYPVFRHTFSGHSAIIEYRLRPNTSVLCDRVAWENYTTQVPYGQDTDLDKPRIWISREDSGTEVRIAVVDSAGRISNIVPLKQGLPYK